MHMYVSALAENLRASSQCGAGWLVMNLLQHAISHALLRQTYSKRSATPCDVQPTLQLQLQDILKSYLDRNYTTMYSNVYPVWQAS